MCDVTTVKLITLDESAYHQLLAKSLEVTRLEVQITTVKHTVKYHIQTTLEQSVGSFITTHKQLETIVQQMTMLSSPKQLSSPASHGSQGQWQKICSKIDLVRPLNQIPVALKHIEKTAIATPFDVLESPYVTFGLHNAAQACPRLADLVTQRLDCCHP